MIKSSVYPLIVGVWLRSFIVEILDGAFYAGLVCGDANGKLVDGGKNGGEGGRGRFDLHGGGAGRVTVQWMDRGGGRGV